MNAPTAAELRALRELELVARAIADADMDETYPALHKALARLDRIRDKGAA